MKKIYLKPTLSVNVINIQSFMSVSFTNTDADQSLDVLGKDNDWEEWNLDWEEWNFEWEE